MVTKYELKEIDGVEFWAIRLLEGDYAGVVYRYDTIKFTGETEEGDGILTFTFNILDNAGNEPSAFVGSAFETTIGDVLVELLEESLDYMETRDKNDNNRTQDSSSTDSQ